jgi:transcription termination factor NusB
MKVFQKRFSNESFFEMDIDSMAEVLAEELGAKVSPDNQFFLDLYHSINSKQEEIKNMFDKKIQLTIENPIIEDILSCGIGELLTSSDSPKIIINEYVTMARIYEGPRYLALINGVLQSVANEKLKI